MEAAPTDDRDSATFSIESSDRTQPHTVGKLPSADDTILPAFRRAAVQIVSQSLSPRRQHEKATVNNHNGGTMQITKLVLKTPPGSPKRQPKAPGIIIHSLQTLAAPVLCTGHDHETGTEPNTKHSIKNHNVLMENRNIPATHEDTITAPAYRIIPIDPSGGKHRKEERTTTSEAQELVRDSFKENKTPPPSPAVVVTRLTGSLGSSDSDSRIAVTEQKTRLASKGSLSAMKIQSQAIVEPTAANATQLAVNEVDVSSVRPIPATRRSLLMETVKPKDPAQAALAVLKENTHKSTDTPVETSNFALESRNNEQTATSKPGPHMKSLRPKHPLPANNNRSTPNECAKKKEKSYDPVRAREFIREQQAKRRQEKKDPPASASGSLPMTEKDLIKQRLENLRKSSHTLVKKNVLKARTRSASCTPKDPRDQATSKPTGKAQPTQTAPRPSVPKPPTMRKFSSTPSLRLVSVGGEPKVDEKCFHKAPTKAPLPVEKSVPTSVLKHSSVSSHSVTRDPVRVGKLRPSSAQTSSSSVTLTSRPATVGQKIGILRKPDNVLLEDILPFSPLKNPQTLALMGPTSNAFSTRSRPTTMVNAQLIVINDEERDGGKPLNEAEKELKLEVPDVTLVPPAPSSIEREDDGRKVYASQEHDRHQSHHSIKSIPPWLKQSLRQPDPYPFILAVRKKLEAVRNVRAEEEAKNRTMKPFTEKQEEVNARTNAYLDVIHGVPRIGQKPTEVTPVPMANNEPSLISTNISGNGEFNTSSEISSIKSDVALPLPPLFSSTKIELVPARIDHHHPTAANAPVSPLSIEQIASLKIISTPAVSDISRSPRRQEDKHVEERVRPMPPPPQPSGLPESSDRTQRELDYQRMLDAFNRSLTHVIEVNQQLYSALQKPPSPQRPVAMPQEILKIRDEMTQTSAPLTVVSSGIGDALAVPQARKALSSVMAFPSPSATTASHYSDDFEQQSQTGLETPQKKSPTMSSFSSPSSSSPSSSASSSSSSPSASPTGSGDGTSSTASATSSHSVTDRRESDSKPTTANNNSSEFDSRSSGHSDHNNTANNNIPPVAEEYLPSFEESLRRGQMSDSRHTQDNSDRDAKHTNRKKDSASNATGGESSIGEEIHSIAIDGEERSFYFKTEEATERKLKENFVPGASVVMEKPSPSRFRKASIGDTTLGSDLLATIFNRTDLEVSILSTTVSETNLSYSSIGWYDQLIHSERSREAHLISRVQSKQKALLNRAKGQLAWLELQKQRYRERGQTEHISGIKKKQRAILVRLEKEREELNRTISKSSADSTNNTTLRSGRSPLTAKNMNSKLSSYCSSPPAVDSTSLALRKASSNLESHHHHSRLHGSSPQRKRRIAGTTTTSNSIHIAIRGRELEPNERLEDILLRREEELHKRKDHVRRLLEWHRKLEREEADLLAVEEKLRAYNDRKLLGKDAHHKNHPTSSGPSIEARMRSIEKSLKTLHSIPSAQVHRNRTPDQPAQGEVEEEEVVMLDGKKLNRLWRRLTGLKTQRYEIERSYRVTRSMLEVLYEDAKRWVLESLRPGEEQRDCALLDESNVTNSSLATIHTGTTAIPSSANTSALGNVSSGTMVADEDMLERGEPPEEVVESKPPLSAHQVDVGDALSSSDKKETNEHRNIPEESLREDEELPAAEGPKSGELLSSTVKSWSPESRRSTGSVEFHTLEETAYQTADFGSQEESPGDDAAVQSESYSTTFEERSIVEGEHTQPLLEDMSLPPALLNATASFLFSEVDQREGSDRSSSVMYELQGNLAQEDPKVESEQELVTQSFRSSLSESMVQSLEEATGSSGECVSTATTPSTVTPTMAIEAINEEILEPGTVDALEEREEEVAEEEQEIRTFRDRSSPSYGSSASELEKRLVTLHDELEELSESFERTPLMRSPTTPPPPQPVQAPPLTTNTMVHKLEQHVSSSETPTFEEDRSDDDDDNEHDEGETDEDSEATLSETSNHRKGEDGTNNFLVVNNASLITIDPQPPKMEVMVRSKTMIPDRTLGAISIAGSGSSVTRDYPPAHSLLTVNSGSSLVAPPPVRMPDIINEAEVLRRQELRIEQEIKVLEQQVGFFREIPNKPPPPYIPPANGSPLALLFPPESRIDELIDGRLEELYHQRLPAERLCSDHVTNVYEKLTLDMCNELFRDLRPPEPTVSFRALTHDKRPLAFYNPPDKLGCLRDYLRRKVKRILNEEQQQQHHLVQAQNPLQYHQQQWLHHLQHHQQHHLHHYHQNQVHQQQQQQQQQLLHQCATVPLVYANGACAGKRKRDQVDEILAEEMHDDDAHWTNFDREEVEVKDRITDELLKSLFGEALRDMTEAYRRKLQRKEEATSARMESAM